MIDIPTYRLALTQLAYGNSRFCFLKFTKPDHGHHLQAPPLLQALNSYNMTDLFYLDSTAANRLDLKFAFNLTNTVL